MKNRNLAACGSLLLLALALALVVSACGDRPRQGAAPLPTSTSGVTGMGRGGTIYAERFDAELSSAIYPALQANNYGAGPDLNFVDQGAIAVDNQQIVLVDEFGSATVTTDTAVNLMELVDSTPVMTGGTNVYGALNVDLGIGNSTGGTNSVYAILVDSIAADAQNTEVGIGVSSGWDYAADFDGAVKIDGGLTDIGSGTYTTADGDNDLGVAGDVEVAGTSDLRGNVTDSGGTFTIADNAAITGTLDVQGASLNYGPNNLYPLGVDSSGFEVVWGTATISNSGTVTHGLTSPLWATCTYSGTLTDNEEQLCSVGISGATVTVYTYKETGAAGDSEVAINWLVVGLP
jgi:hypothetical protein